MSWHLKTPFIILLLGVKGLYLFLMVSQIRPFTPERPINYVLSAFPYIITHLNVETKFTKKYLTESIYSVLFSYYYISLWHYDRRVIIIGNVYSMLWLRLPTVCDTGPTQTHIDRVSILMISFIFKVGSKPLPGGYNMIIILIQGGIIEKGVRPLVMIIIHYTILRSSCFLSDDNNCFPKMAISLCINFSSQKNSYYNIYNPHFYLIYAHGCSDLPAL